MEAALEKSKEESTSLEHELGNPSCSVLISVAIDYNISKLF